MGSIPVGNIKKAVTVVAVTAFFISPLTMYIRNDMITILPEEYRGDI